MFALKWIHTRIMSFETDSYSKGGSSSVHAPAIQHAIRNRQLFLRWVKLCVSTCNPAPSELKLIIIIIIIPLLSLFIIHIFIYSSIYLFIYLFIIYKVPCLLLSMSWESNWNLKLLLQDIYENSIEMTNKINMFCFI